jgi:hypothetical protein
MKGFIALRVFLFICINFLAYLNVHGISRNYPISADYIFPKDGEHTGVCTFEVSRSFRSLKEFSSFQKVLRTFNEMQLEYHSHIGSKVLKIHNYLLLRFRLLAVQLLAVQSSIRKVTRMVIHLRKHRGILSVIGLISGCLPARLQQRSMERA